MPGLNPHDRTKGEETYLTPPELITALGPFDLDPCAAPDPKPWATAREQYTLPQDGLALPWVGRVWLNPPYGAKTLLFMKKLAEHGDGIALVFARTETVWFQCWASRANGFFFPRGRYTFYRPDGTPVVNPKTGRPTGAGAPSVLVAFGAYNAARLESYAQGVSGLFVRKMEITGPQAAG